MFLAFLGLQRFLSASPKAGSGTRLGAWVWPLTAVSVISAPILLLLYYASPFGNVGEFARDGWVAGYARQISAGISQGAH
jgi:hypothetical protein